ncbi:MAG: hypothetical protein ACOVLC_10970 [Flavobacterium sp.]
MKKKFYLVLLLGISFLILVNCAEPELETIKNVEDGVSFGVKPTKVSRIDAATVAQNPRMTQLMHKLQRKTIYKTVANQRTMTDSTAFKLQLTDIVMIEDQGYVSYTFGVLREQENDLLENVIINVYPGGVIKTYFVEYDVTALEREMIKNNIEVNLDGKTESFLIDDFEEVFSNPDALYLRIPLDFRLCPVVTTVTTSDTCGHAQQHNWTNYNECLYYTGSESFGISPGTWIPAITTTYSITYVSCEGGGSLGGGQTGDVPVGGNPIDGGGNYAGGGGGTNGSTPNNPTDPTNPTDPDNGMPDDFSFDDSAVGDIKTVPVVPKPITKDQNKKNCDKLSEMIQNVAIKNSLVYLKGKVNSHREYGFNYSLDTNAPIVECELADENDLNIKMKFGGSIYGFSHTHPFENTTDKVMPMFSITDIFGFGNLIIRHNNPNADPSIFFLSLTVSNGSNTETFVLKIDNKQSFISWSNSFHQKSKADKELIGRMLQSDYQKRMSAGGGYSGYVKDLLNFMNKHNINGISIYKANDINFTGWKKIELNNEGDTVEEINCN